MEMRYDKEDLQQALEVLRKGGVILYPTDTVWGIGCDATNADAVSRVYEIKKRVDSKAMLVLLDGAGKLDVPTFVPSYQIRRRGEYPPRWGSNFCTESH